MLAGSDRSASICCSSAPLRAAISARCAERVRETVITRAPSASSRAASASPRPRLAPVTTATVEDRALIASDSLFEGGDDEWVEIAVENLLRIRDFDVGAQVLDAALIEHVGADLVAPAHVGLGILQLLLFGHALTQLELVQPRAKHLHGFGAVAVLRAVVLALHDDTGGNVGNAYGRVGLVDVLTAGAAGPVGVDAQIGGVDLDLD